VSSTNPNRTALAVFIGALALIGGVLAAVFISGPRTVAIESGTLLQAPRPLPAFSLTDESGQAFTNAALQGHWTLLFPGFTYCPDICPATLAQLKAVRNGLGDRADRLQVLLFSIDPERDTPETLARYVHHFDPSFKGATTGEPELRDMAQALGVAYIKVPGETEQSYTMDHSAALVLINPRGEIAGYFTPPLRTDALTQDLAQILDGGA
jgi:protein SCO1